MNIYPTKSIYNPVTKAIEHKAIRSIKGDVIKKLEINRVGGYMNVYTDETDRDLYTEFFDKTTDFMDEFGWSMVGKPILIEHGLDGTFKSMHVGVFDFESEDDVGRYVEGRLFDRAEYVEMLTKYSQRKGLNWSKEEIAKKAELAHKTVQAFFATGEVHWSSGALPQEVEVNPENGHIKRWPRIEGSGTMTPAEPDKTDVLIKGIVPNFEHTLKSAFEQLDAILDEYLYKSMPANPVREADVPIEQNADNEQSQAVSPIETQKQGKNTMDILQKIVAMIQEYLAAAGGGEESEAMATAVVDELKADMPEEEVAKAMDEEEMVKAIAEKAYKLADAKLAQKQKALNSLDAMRNERMKALERNAQPVDPFSSGGAKSEFSGKRNQVSVGEERRYAHLSASDMALGIVMRLAPAKSQGIPVNLRDAVSESYLRTFVNKAQKFADSDPYSRGKLAGKSFGHMQQAQAADMALKTAIPFRANEVNASDISGQGSDWVSEWWSTDLWERERFERHYDALVQKGMMVQTIPQGADTAHFPTEGSDPVAYVAPQANSTGADGRPETTANFNPYTTGVVDCTPLEIKLATSQTVILEEDSIINVVQNVNRQLNEAALETRDKLLVNGDNELGTTNINYDGTTVPTGLSRPYYTAADGFRYHGLTNNSVDASNTLALNTYRLTLAELDPELRQYYDRMVFMIDPTTEMASLAIPEIATDDVRRTFATVQSGRIMNVYGIDVRVNGFIPQTDTDGKVTASGNVANRGTILLVYAPYWGFAYKRQITLETARNIYSGTNDYVMSMRIGMVARGTNATALTYNVATAVS